MYDDMMTMDDALTVSMNIHAIETHLGHEFDTPYLDIKALSEKSLTPDEAYIYAANIRQIEGMRRPQPTTPLDTAFWNFIGNINQKLMKLVYKDKVDAETSDNEDPDNTNLDNKEGE